MSAQAQLKLSAEEYLAIDRNAEVRSEFYRGEVFAMAGASYNHSLIVAALMRRLGNQIEGSPCRVVSQDMRVRIEREDAYVYPDVVGFCAKPEFASDHFDTLLNPELIIEVLSPTTEMYDRGLKFMMYQKLPSLKEFLIVAQDRPWIEHYERQADGGWLLHGYSEMSAEIRIKCMNCVITPAQVYEHVSWLEA